MDDAENRLSRVLSNDSLSDELQIMDYVGLNYLKRFTCNIEQAPGLTAVSGRGDAEGFGGGARV